MEKKVNDYEAVEHNEKAVRASASDATVTMNKSIPTLTKVLGEVTYSYSRQVRGGNPPGGK